MITLAVVIIFVVLVLPFILSFIPIKNKHSDYMHRYIYYAKLAMAVIFVLMVFYCIVFFIPLKDMFFGVPYFVKVSPAIHSKDKFSIELELPCNRLYEREIGLLFDPPIPERNLSGANEGISGNVELTIYQDGKTEIVKHIEILSGLQGRLSSDGIGSKTIYRYPPIGGFFCGDQKISISAENINFNLKKHSIVVYVSRDTRP